MLKDLHILQDLQKIDLVIDSFQNNKEEFPKLIEQFNQRLGEEKHKIEVKKQALLELPKKKKGLELDLSDKEEKIKKSEEKMMLVKSNEEYQAMKKEIEMARAQNSFLEEQILEVMLQLDEVKNALNIFEQEMSNSTKVIEAQKKKVEDDLSHLDELLMGKKGERETLLKDLSKESLSAYNRLRTKKALAVTETRNGKCVGCSMSLPPQFYNEIQKCDTLRFCPSCQRILIYTPTT